LRVLAPQLDWAAFLDRIGVACSRLLLLDYDGTLAPFHVRPELAKPFPEVLSALKDIMMAGGTRVVIISGRPADEVPPLLGLKPHPEIWGSHGRERLRSDGQRTVQAPDAVTISGLADAAGVLDGILPQGSRLEFKLASLALHWRALSDDAARRLRWEVMPRWQPIAERNALEILDFDGGLEMRVSGCGKQYAIDTLLSETPPDRAVAYLGDDITDEDAFRAIKTRGVGILVRPQFRDTAADVWLKPSELVSFLRRWRVERRKMTT
jgi:trehalose 6-phosphate phosphatase